MACAQSRKKRLVVAAMDREGPFVFDLEPRPRRASRAVGAGELTLVVCPLEDSIAHGSGDVSRSRRLSRRNLARARWSCESKATRSAEDSRVQRAAADCSGASRRSTTTHCAVQLTGHESPLKAGEWESLGGRLGGPCLVGRGVFVDVSLRRRHDRPRTANAAVASSSPLPAHERTWRRRLTRSFPTTRGLYFITVALAAPR